MWKMRYVRKNGGLSIILDYELLYQCDGRPPKICFILLWLWN
jgi:hypothetical protein